MNGIVALFMRHPIEAELIPPQEMGRLQNLGSISVGVERHDGSNMRGSPSLRRTPSNFFNISSNGRNKNLEAELPKINVWRLDLQTLEFFNF